MSAFGECRKSRLRAGLSLTDEIGGDVFPVLADFVAKVVLQKVSKFLRAAGSVFVYRCDGPRRLTLNS
jgi:hypothetical protein